ncbi:MAG: DegT/DnrJ/EryC1/StrS family aminotransferase [Chloroflexi bacterium]|nr:MAG: DegT/DnrJ/EryC1/StrS family aminotransferase [Chloroflexota bacterium]
MALNGSVRFVDLQAQIRSLQPALSEAIQAVLDRGDFILGKDVELFEQEFAAYCGVADAVGVDSGLSALELALRALRVGPGDEVITQANTFIASVGAILAVGARPVLVDCDDDGAIRPDAVRAALTPATRAIMPVHLFGRVCDIEAITAIADAAGVPVVEDACQAHGAVLDGRRAGSFGIASAFSFYPAKNLGAFGDGGMLVTRSREVANTVRQLRNYGQQAKYQHVSLPLNHRLDTIQAAVLRVKLPHLDSWNARRQYLADAYREHLEGVPVRIAPAGAQGRHVYHLFVIETEHRDRLREALQARRVETGIHYPAPLHLQAALEDLGYRRGAFPTAERLAAHSLSLPMYPEMPLAQVELVADGIRAGLHG